MSSVRREARKRRVSFYSRHSSPIPQLPTPGTASQALAPGYQASELRTARLWNSLAFLQCAHLGCAAGCRSFQWTLALGRVLELSELTQHGGVTAHVSLEGAFHSISTCSPRREKEPLLHSGKESEVTRKFNEQAQHSNSRHLSAVKWCFLSRGEQ